jgi:hypothetical protein
VEFDPARSEGDEDPFITEAFGPRRRATMKDEERTCKVPGCARTDVVARGLCRLCYDRYRRGDEDLIRVMGKAWKRRLVGWKKEEAAVEEREILTAAPKSRKLISAPAPKKPTVELPAGRERRARGDGDLEKAVNILIALGMLSQQRLNAALELAKESEKGEA